MIASRGAAACPASTGVAGGAWRPRDASRPPSRAVRPHVGHHYQTVGERSAVRSRDRHRHAQSFTIEVLEELSLPREISVAPGTETTDREVSVDAHAPHVVGDSDSERFNASDIATPLLECVPSHRQHLTPRYFGLAPPHGTATDHSVALYLADTASGIVRKFAPVDG